MPKPNKYTGSGSKKPEGTVEGSYVMHKGRMVQQFRATGESIKRGINAYKAYKKGSSKMLKALGYVALVCLCVCFVLALAGCQVNVVNVIHSDIGLDTSSQTVNEGGRL